MERINKNGDQTNNQVSAMNFEFLLDAIYNKCFAKLY